MFNFFSKNHIRYGIIALACSFLSSIAIKNTQAELAIPSVETTDSSHEIAAENENEENELWDEVERMLPLARYNIGVYIFRRYSN